MLVLISREPIRVENGYIPLPTGPGLGLELDERGNVKASERAYQTSIGKIFTAGDMRRGQSLVVWAISEGRECARKVDEFLMGESHLASKDRIKEFVV